MSYRIDYSSVDPTQLRVFTEGRKRRIFVGTLFWNDAKQTAEFHYDPKYTHSRSAIPVGHELDLFKSIHKSKKGLFPSFLERIPLKENPAYPDYCRAMGISVDESNPIILLISIGRRGPSTFVYEPVVKNDFSVADIKKFRADLDISINDMALAFDLNQPTLQRLEAGKNVELATLRRIEILLKFPEVALWQLRLTAGYLHGKTFQRLWSHFEKFKAQRP